MKNKRIIICAVLAAIVSVSLLSGCKPTSPDGSGSISEPVETTVTTEKENKSTENKKDVVSTVETGSFDLPIGTNGDNDDMNSPLDVSLTINYGTGGQFYDTEAIYGYLKNKDTLIYDSPMFDIICEYVLRKEQDMATPCDMLAQYARTEGYNSEEVKKNCEAFLSVLFPNVDVETISNRLLATGASEFANSYIKKDEYGDYMIKNEESVYTAIYKSVANYYNAKYFGQDFTAGTKTFEGDPELVYDYTIQHGGVVEKMLNTKNESGFEMSVDTYDAPFFTITTKYNIIGQKNGMYP